VREVAAPLPLQIICSMMGIPEEDEDRVFGWTNVILGEFEDADDYAVFEQVSREIGEYGVTMAIDRRRHPQDDLCTALVEAEVDGERLTDPEIASFFILLATAGNETTRNAISHGVMELTRHPDQRERWSADFDAHAKTAVEEIVRWASPVIYMRRRVTEDTEVGGQEMKAGDKVAMWYASANRDEAHFPIRTGSTSLVIPTRRWATAPAGPISASEPTSPDARSRWPSASSSSRCPTSTPSPSPRCCAHRSSTESNGSSASSLPTDVSRPPFHAR
jgi:hypothetical protein